MKTPRLPSPALQRVRELQEQGHNQRDIAQILESEGIPAPGRSKTWNQSAVRLFLQRLDEPAPTPSPASGSPAPSAVPPPAEVDPPPAASPSEPSPKPPVTRRLKVKIQGPWIDTDSLLWGVSHSSGLGRADRKNRPHYTAPKRR